MMVWLVKLGAAALLVSGITLGTMLPAAAQESIAKTPGTGANPKLAEPDLKHDVKNFSKDVPWPEGKTPTAPAGFKVTPYAKDLDHPRWMHVLPNGDVLVAESATEPKKPKDEEEEEKLEKEKKSKAVKKSANRITLLRDANGDGVVDQRSVFLEDLNQPFGMALIGSNLYIANTNGVLRYPFQVGQTEMKAPGEKILNLPAGGYNNHWTRNLLAARDGRKLYVSVGSASNVGEHGLEEETRRACILEINPDGSGERTFASGLRNPVGMAWEPTTGALWTAVNERDMIGDDLVPDYITGVTPGGFYGWPFSYWGKNPDPRLDGEGKELVAKALEPDYGLGAHTASLGLTFYTGSAFPAPYRGGAFVGQHGSWNRKDFTGYKVVFVPFQNGKPAGPPQDFLTGFMADEKKGEAYGRPVGVEVDRTGGLLVADDSGNVIWRVAPATR